MDDDAVAGSVVVWYEKREMSSLSWLLAVGNQIDCASIHGELENRRIGKGSKFRDCVAVIVMKTNTVLATSGAVRLYTRYLPSSYLLIQSLG